jgi:circadian clock protein KaiC
MNKLVRDLAPAVVIVDPISNLEATGSVREANAMLIRLVDNLKANGITALLTNLSSHANPEQTDVRISSIVDTWLLLQNIELGGERNRAIYVLKSRGMSHSNRVREFLITDNGVGLVELAAGTGKVSAKRRKGAESRNEP